MIEAIRTLTEIEAQHTSGAYPKRPLTVVRGAGCTVWDENGRAYLDATSGQSVALLGHSHPAVVEAITSQAAQLITCPEIFYNDQRARLYEVLETVLPSAINRFFLCNSGAEAIEGALKVARLLTGRTGIVAAKRAFHGRTLGALSLTWNKDYREPFAPWQPAVMHVTYNDLDSARVAISEETAAVVVEAIQGEGGVYPADADYLRGLRELCDTHGALLIVDEIQTGFGRTGRWFAFQHSDIVPDVVALAKGIAGGVPMGAVAWRGELGTIPGGSHGSTFGGNPLACAAAVAVITTLREENLVERTAELGAWFRDEVAALSLTQVREVRGLGLMVALELRGRVTPVLKTLQEDYGILALPAGLNVLRLLPPLVISREQLATIRDALAEVLS
ncbi:MAG: acetylornithine/succinylornithine family transaminase [Anaerolineaceae bacterium]|nr:acetylornithine/succinylornithine family transaminase [Anaerolineaceae bacterium]